MKLALRNRAFVGLTAALLALPSGFAAVQAQTVRAALLADPASLDPIYDTSLPALNVFYNIYDQLTTIDATGAVVPRLAESWSVSEDLKTWVFTMREDAVFHDGSPVTADDVVFTFMTAKSDPTSRMGGYLGTIETIEATGTHEVTFSLNTPFAPFDRQATLIPIVSAQAYQAMGREAFARAPIGSGPYRLMSWVNSDTITLARFDDYWGSPGTFDTVIFQPVPDETTRANSVQSGDLDIALLGPSMVPAVTSAGAVDVVNQLSNRVVYLGFNVTHPALANPLAREGMSLAIDRALLSERLLNGAVEPAAQLVAPVSFGFDPALAPVQQDLDRARALLAEAGYSGEPVPLQYPTTGLPQIDQVAQVVAFFLGEAGVNVQLDGIEASTFSGTWFGRQLQGLFLFAFAPSVMDANLPFSMLLRTGGQGYHSDSTIDDLLTAQIGAADLTERAAILSEISSIVIQNTYYAPIFIDTYTYGVTPGLNWQPRPDGMIVFQ